MSETDNVQDELLLVVGIDEDQGHTEIPQQGLASDSGLPSHSSNHPPNSINDDGIGQSNLLKGLLDDRGERIVDQVHGTRRNKELLNDLFAKIGAHLEMTRYSADGPELMDRVNALEGTLTKFVNVQEEYIKSLETAMKHQQERCVDLSEKMYKAENQYRDLETQLNVTKKSFYEISQTHSNRDMRDYRGDSKEIMVELQQKREEVLYYKHEIKVFDERFARQVQINEKNQQLINHYRCKYDYGIESDSEIMSLRQQKQALEKQLCEARNNSNYYNNAYQSEKAERKELEDSFRREFQQMRQRVNEAEARASELQRKNNLLKEEVTRVLGDTTNLPILRSEAKELAGGPSRCDPFAELEKENKVLRDQNAELEERLCKKLGAETQLENLKTSFLHEFKNMQQSFETKTSELQNLLNSEVTNIKAVLGDITNVSWGDNDKNYSVQLGKDILKLQN
ncbi:1711_t:CDS:1, partial [Paraglomus occultum]